MIQKKLGNTSLNLTRIGLGTWAIGGGNWKFGWGPQDDAESIRTIHRAMELGINWIDTAPAYGLGHCEEVVGRALREMSVRPIIATKCGRCWKDDRQLYPCIKKESIREEVEASLSRLGIETIDLYQIHWPQPDEDIEEAWGEIARLIQAGKIRYAGVSNFNVDQLKRIQPIHPVASLQPPYSMLARGIENELLPYCQQHGIGVIVYSPMQKGLLTGKVTREWLDSLASDDHRRNDPNFQEPKLSNNLNLVDHLKVIAAKYGSTPAQISIAWTLRKTEVTAAIVGARRPDQIESTGDASDLIIDPSDWDRIDGWLSSSSV